MAMRTKTANLLGILEVELVLIEQELQLRHRVPLVERHLHAGKPALANPEYLLLQRLPCQAPGAVFVDVVHDLIRRLARLAELEDPVLQVLVDACRAHHLLVLVELHRGQIGGRVHGHL